MNTKSLLSAAFCTLTIFALLGGTSAHAQKRSSGHGSGSPQSREGFGPPASNAKACSGLNGKYALVKSSSKTPCPNGIQVSVTETSVRVIDLGRKDYAVGPSGHGPVPREVFGFSKSDKGASKYSDDYQASIKNTRVKISSCSAEYGFVDAGVVLGVIPTAERFMHSLKLDKNDVLTLKSKKYFEEYSCVYKKNR